MKPHLIFLFTFIFFSCSNNEKSGIEKIIFGAEEVAKLHSTSDSIKRIPAAAESCCDTYNYFIKDGSVVWVWVDKVTGIVVGTKTVKDNCTFNQVEYYKTTGQLKGKAASRKMDSTGDYREGLVKHYYEDGRIKLMGHYKKSVKVGNWKYYDINGDLDSTVAYSNTGEL